MDTLVEQSFSVILSGQGANGAYVASPYYPTYNYCWFRDGTFIAHAMDLWHRQESATRFYEWATTNIIERESIVERCVSAVRRGEPITSAMLLDTRYTLNGEPGDESWPNFQLDGFGILLWGLRRHLQLTATKQISQQWTKAIHLLIHYLSALWQHPNYDCWEEFPDQIAVSTLAALYAGLHAVRHLPDVASHDVELAEATTQKIKDFVLIKGVIDDHLIKQIEGKDVVDASLLWACVPFDSDGMLEPGASLMRATATRIASDLTGKTGSVHRYLADVFYGGGEWMLLTTLLGEYFVAINDRERALRCLEFAEAHANHEGWLPEQISVAALHPEYYDEWRKRWGPVACPLLWSHAAYLSLYARLHDKQ